MSPLALSIRFLQTQPDSRLVELARAGHERAFEALVQRYRRPLLAYCRRLAGSDAGAEDALQQALLQAWVALGSADTEVRDVRAWLYRIVHNVLVSNLRRRNDDPVGVDQTEGSSGADHEVEQRIAVRQALAGLASLPELQRRVMMSTALEGRSHDEIAVALGLSHGAVRGLIYRARATLRAAAAVVMPLPMVNWLARQDVSGGGRSTALYEAMAAGSGSAGLGAVLLKGGALVATAGALATAAGITSSPGVHRSHHPVSVPAVHSAARGAGGHGHAARAVAGVLSLSGSGSGARTATHGMDRTAARSAAPSQSGERGRHGRGRDARPLAAFAPVGSGRSGGGASNSGSSGSGSGGGSGAGHGGGSDGGAQSGSSAGQASGTGSGGDHGGGSGGTPGDGGSGSGGHGGGGSGGDHGGPAAVTTTSSANVTTTSSTVTTATTSPSGDGSGGGKGSDGGNGSGSGDGSSGSSGHGD